MLPLTGFDLQKHFWKAVIITLWVASTQFVTLGIAILIATLLHEKPFGARLFQILFFIPYICSTVAVAMMWRWILDTDGGILNSILGKNIDWLYDPDYMTWCIILATIWQAPGYGIVMYKAAFTNINSNLYEAAALDGAGFWEKFFYVTLPGISPTTFFLMQAGVISGLLTYDLAVLIIPAGFGFAGKEEMGLTLIRLVYYLINERNTADPGLMVSAACIISWLVFIVTGVLSMILFRMREKSAE
jgi:multiple sugar transport system permease protein